MESGRGDPQDESAARWTGASAPYESLPRTEWGNLGRDMTDNATSRITSRITRPYYVKVRGRGGTVLQPGIDLLERSEDFPQDGPVLIITDGFCDRIHIRREHAFLLPEGRHLSFVPKGRVFRIR